MKNGIRSVPLKPFASPLANAVNHFLQIDRLEALYARASAEQGFVRRLLDDLEIRVNVSPADFEKIPTTAAVLALSNHPFVILDGVMLADLLSRVRPGSGSRDFIPNRCSVSMRDLCGNWDRRSNWGGHSFVLNTSASLRRCFCCGRESPRGLHGIRSIRL